MITTIASAYEAAADGAQAEPHLAWQIAWQKLRDNWAAGMRPGPVELLDYLTDVPADDRPNALYDLIAEHMRLTWANGCGLTLADYSSADYSRADYSGPLSGFQPNLAAADWPADLIEDEFVARSTPAHGDQPPLAEYTARFPGREDVQALLARRCLANERYVKLRVLGAGLLGVVHLAYDRLGRRQVAVKEVLASDQLSESSRALFHEAKLTAELAHPSIVPIFDVGYTASSAFYVMAYLAGETLAERIRVYHEGRMERGARENRKLLAELLGCVIQIATAVAHAHDRGILHRDLKPGNVLLAKDGQPVIVDWGFARRIRSESGDQCNEPTNAAVGTAQYMAPEQVAGQESSASDIFSLGAVLYEVLTARPPYDWPASLPADWRESVQRAAIAPAAKKVPRDQAQLAAICMNALAQAPHERPASALDLANALQSYLNDHSSRGWWRSLLPGGWR